MEAFRDDIRVRQELQDHGVSAQPKSAAISPSPEITATRATGEYNVPRGTVLLTVQQAIIYPISFIFYLLIARILTKSDVGEISLLLAAIAIFGAITQVALPVAATQFISGSIAHRDSSTAAAVAKTTTRLVLMIASPSLLLVGLLSPWIGSIVFGNGDAALLLVVTFVSAFLLDLIALYGAYFLGLGLYAQRAYQFILFVPLSRGIGLILAYLGLGVLGIVLGWAIGAMAALLLSMYFWRGRLPQGSSYPVRPLFQFSAPLFAAALITLGQGWGDLALLQAIRGQLATTGAYFLVVNSVGGIGLSSVGPLSVIWSPVAAALYPALAAGYSKAGREAVSRMLNTAFRLTNLLVLPVGTALAAVAPTALELAYGNSYAVEALPFAILTLTAIFASQATLLTTALQAMKKTPQLLKVTLVATIVDLTVVALTAKPLGTTGGAIGRGLLGLTTVLLAQRALGPTISASTNRGIRKAIFLAAALGFPLFLTDQSLVIFLHLKATLRLPILLAVFALVFLTACRWLSVFESDDFAVLRAAVPSILQRPLKAIQRILTKERPAASK